MAKATGSLECPQLAEAKSDDRARVEANEHRRVRLSRSKEPTRILGTFEVHELNSLTNCAVQRTQQAQLTDVSLETSGASGYAVNASTWLGVVSDIQVWGDPCRAYRVDLSPKRIPFGQLRSYGLLQGELREVRLSFPQEAERDRFVSHLRRALDAWNAEYSDIAPP